MKLSMWWLACLLWCVCVGWVTAADLYPEIEPFAVHYLNVTSLHTIYVEESGNPNGMPILYLHGGPGGGTSPRDRRYFDPDFYHIILLDQRGCGKSTPSSELRENDTWELVKDIETIRVLLGIEEWMVFGGSWGSTLSITYAETYPDRVIAMILRGIYTNRVGEADWLYKFGASEIFPEAWQDFLTFIPVGKRYNLVNAYYELMTGDDEEMALAAARHWSEWECKIAKLQPDNAACEQDDDKSVWEIGRIECHYFYHNCFFDSSNYLLNNVSKIRHIPTVTIHGRYDVVCPLRNAYELQSVWPEMELQVADVSGHSATEEQITSMLVDATNNYRDLFSA